MKRWVITWSTKIFFLLVIVEAAWALPQITTTVHNDQKSISFQQTCYFSHSNNLSLRGKFAPVIKFYDNGICRFEPNVALQVAFPPLGPITMQFGDVRQDARMLPFFKTGFTLFSLKEEGVGPLHTTLLPLEKKGSPAVALSNRFFDNLYAHIITWTPMHEDAGFGGIASLFEWQYNNSLIRTGILFSESKNREEHSWIIPYSALALTSGMVGYFQLIEDHTFHPVISIHATLLLRFSYDRANGKGLTNSIYVKGTVGDLFWTLQTIDIPLRLGAIGQQAFTTIDAPLHQGEVTCGYHGSEVEILLTVRDSQWRLTPFSAMSQRRRLQWTGLISFSLCSCDFHLQGRVEKRWNRSGSVGKSYNISIGVSKKVGSVNLKYTPSIKWGSGLIFGGELVLSKALGFSDTMQIRLKHNQQVVRVSGIWERKIGNARFKLEWHDDKRVSVIYSIFLTK